MAKLKENVEVLRRSVAFSAARVQDIKTIQQATGATTGNAAVNGAIEFYAPLSHRTIEEIEVALGLLDIVEPRVEAGDKMFILNKAYPLTPTQRAHATILVPFSLIAPV